MAAGPFMLFDAFKEKLGNALIDLDTAAVPHDAAWRRLHAISCRSCCVCRYQQ